MQPIHRILAALLLAAGLPLHAAAQEEASDTVRLRFGWTPGMRAEVEYEQVRVRSMNGQRDSLRLASTYRMEVAAHPEGLTVTYADMRWSELPRMEGPTGEFFQGLAQTSAGGKLASVVSSAGDFLRAEGMAEVQEGLMQALGPIADQLQGEIQLGEVIRSMVSEEALTAAAVDEWNALVGAWLDADVEVGATYELDASFQSPLFPGVELPTSFEIEVLRRLPCTPDDAGAECVELALGNYPDQEALAQAIGGLLERLGAPPEQLESALAALAVESHVRLVTEPGTLRPHLLETLKLVNAAEGEDEEAAQREVSRYIFRYPR